MFTYNIANIDDIADFNIIYKTSAINVNSIRPVEEWIKRFYESVFVIKIIREDTTVGYAFFKIQVLKETTTCLYLIDFNLVDIDNTEVSKSDNTEVTRNNIHRNAYQSFFGQMMESIEQLARYVIHYRGFWVIDPNYLNFCYKGAISAHRRNSEKYDEYFIDLLSLIYEAPYRVRHLGYSDIDNLVEIHLTSEFRDNRPYSQSSTRVCDSDNDEDIDNKRKEDVINKKRKDLIAYYCDIIRNSSQINVQGFEVLDEVHGKWILNGAFLFILPEYAKSSSIDTSYFPYCRADRFYQVYGESCEHFHYFIKNNYFNQVMSFYSKVSKLGSDFMDESVIRNSTNLNEVLNFKKQGNKENIVVAEVDSVIEPVTHIHSESPLSATVSLPRGEVVSYVLSCLPYNLFLAGVLSEPDNFLSNITSPGVSFEPKNELTVLVEDPVIDEINSAILLAELDQFISSNSLCMTKTDDFDPTIKREIPIDHTIFSSLIVCASYISNLICRSISTGLVDIINLEDISMIVNSLTIVATVADGEKKHGWSVVRPYNRKSTLSNVNNNDSVVHCANLLTVLDYYKRLFQNIGNLRQVKNLLTYILNRSDDILDSFEAFIDEEEADGSESSDTSSIDIEDNLVLVKNWLVYFLISQFKTIDPEYFNLDNIDDELSWWPLKYGLKSSDVSSSIETLFNLDESNQNLRLNLCSSFTFLTSLCIFANFDIHKKKTISYNDLIGALELAIKNIDSFLSVNIGENNSPIIRESSANSGQKSSTGVGRGYFSQKQDSGENELFSLILSKVPPDQMNCSIVHRILRRDPNKVFYLYDYPILSSLFSSLIDTEYIICTNISDNYSLLSDFSLFTAKPMDRISSGIEKIGNLICVDRQTVSNCQFSEIYGIPVTIRCSNKMSGEIISTENINHIYAEFKLSKSNLSETIWQEWKLAYDLSCLLPFKIAEEGIVNSFINIKYFQHLTFTKGLSISPFIQSVLIQLIMSMTNTHCLLWTDEVYDFETIAETCVDSSNKTINNLTSDYERSPDVESPRRQHSMNQWLISLNFFPIPHLFQNMRQSLFAFPIKNSTVPLKQLRTSCVSNINHVGGSIIDAHIDSKNETVLKYKSQFLFISKPSFGLSLTKFIYDDIVIIGHSQYSINLLYKLCEISTLNNIKFVNLVWCSDFVDNDFLHYYFNVLNKTGDERITDLPPISSHEAIAIYTSFISNLSNEIFSTSIQELTGAAFLKISSIYNCLNIPYFEEGVVSSENGPESNGLDYFFDYICRYGVHLLNGNFIKLNADEHFVEIYQSLAISQKDDVEVFELNFDKVIFSHDLVDSSLYKLNFETWSNAPQLFFSGMNDRLRALDGVYSSSDVNLFKTYLHPKSDIVQSLQWNPKSYTILYSNNLWSLNTIIYILTTLPVSRSKILLVIPEDKITFKTKYSAITSENFINYIFDVVLVDILIYWNCEPHSIEYNIYNIEQVDSVIIKSRNTIENNKITKQRSPSLSSDDFSEIEVKPSHDRNVVRFAIEEESNHTSNILKTESSLIMENLEEFEEMDNVLKKSSHSTSGGQIDPAYQNKLLQMDYVSNIHSRPILSDPTDRLFRLPCRVFIGDLTTRETEILPPIIASTFIQSNIVFNGRINVDKSSFQTNIPSIYAVGPMTSNSYNDNHFPIDFINSHSGNIQQNSESSKSISIKNCLLPGGYHFITAHREFPNNIPDRFSEENLLEFTIDNLTSGETEGSMRLYNCFLKIDYSVHTFEIYRITGCVFGNAFVPSNIRRLCLLNFALLENIQTVLDERNAMNSHHTLSVENFDSILNSVDQDWLNIVFFDRYPDFIQKVCEEGCHLYKDRKEFSDFVIDRLNQFLQVNSESLLTYLLE